MSSWGRPGRSPPTEPDGFEVPQRACRANPALGLSALGCESPCALVYNHLSRVIQGAGRVSWGRLIHQTRREADLKGLLLNNLGLSLLAASVSAPSGTAGPPQGTSLTVVRFKAPEFPSAELDFARPEGQVVSPAIAGPGAGRTGGLGNPSSMPETAIPSAPPVAWINSPSLTVAGLRGKVVLIDFWEYTCINCIRTFAQNKKWYERYRKYGFEIIGVHDPEFDIAYPESNVQAAVKRFGLPYPVVVDSQFKVWNSYRNSTWPNRFVIDARGYVRFNRPGEGADSDFERAIQGLLVEA